MGVVQDQTTVIVVGLAGVLIPVVVATLTKLETKGIVKAGVSVVLAALTAAGTAISGVGDIHYGWKNVVGAMGLAVLAAGGSLAAVWKGELEEKIHGWTGG